MIACAAACLTTGLASVGYAFNSLFERIGRSTALGAQLPDSFARARVEEGFLIGVGSERIQRSPDGRLQIERTRHYTDVRHPDDRRVAHLPEPWDAQSSLRVLPNLRLSQVDTRTQFKRSGDAVFGDQKLSEKHDWLFESDRSLVRATPDGHTLVLQRFRGKQLLATDRYAYPERSVPLDIVALFLTIAVQRHVDQFDFDLLVPGGGVHGVRAQIVRTRDLSRFAKGYRIPPQRLKSNEMLAVVDLRLSSPVKYLFFPHHFFMAFSESTPSKLMLMWGGDPDENLQAFRID